MGKTKYEYLLKPLQIRNFVLKNRMEMSNSTPHFLQGPEKYPADGLMTHYINRAKAGASIVTITGINTQWGLPEDLPKEVDLSHFPEFDVSDPRCQNYLMQLAEAVHVYGSLISVGIFAAGNRYPLTHEDGTFELVNAMSIPIPEELPDEIPMMPDMKEVKKVTKEMPMESLMNQVTDDLSLETMDKIAESFAQQSALAQWLGFDMVTLHMSYRGQLLGQFISPLTNKRTDEYGGDIAGRSKFPIEVFKRIRERVGRNFLIEVQISAEEENGNTTEEIVEFLKASEQYIDIAQIRCGEGDANHPTGFNLKEMPFLDLAEKVKKSGVNLVIGSVGGYMDPQHADDAIREGKLDLVAMARAWISNPDYGKLVKEGRGDDIVPCLRCNKCHGRGPNDPFVTICAVNPVMGLENRIKDMNVESTGKKVAVIGGGPAGMRCALMLKEKGHTPVVFEKSGKLGGAIIHSDYAPFKWPLRQFKDYLIYQLGKQKIEVRLNTPATPEMIEAENFDAVVAALGAKPVMPRIPGIEKRKCFFYEETFRDPDALGRNCVVIGGGEVGVEIGIYLAQKGHKATVLEMRDKLAADSTKIHYYSMLQEAWEAEPDFTGITGAQVTEITEDAVIYLDHEGVKHTVACDSLVLSVGMRPYAAEALEFADCSKEFYMIGDCKKPASIQQAMRSALGAVLQI